MRKNFGVKPIIYPQPVFIIGSYGEDGTADAMNAAWGSIADYDTIALYLSINHKTVANILKKKAFTVSMATKSQVVASDYVGLVSGNQELDKVAKAGWHPIKCTFVDAPMFEELPMCVECRLKSYDEHTHYLLGEIINVNADERILDKQGLIDPKKLQPIIFDAVHNAYVSLGDKVGNAFQDGNLLKNRRI